MPRDRDSCIRQVKIIEREFAAARTAIEFFLRNIRRDPTLLKNPVEVKDVDDAEDRLERTYLIRLFAEFEMIVRGYFRATYRRRPPARTRDLLDSVGARRGVTAELVGDAHRVREYRNQLIHEPDADMQAISIAESRSRLCKFLSYLPIRW